MYACFQTHYAPKKSTSSYRSKEYGINKQSEVMQI